MPIFILNSSVFKVFLLFEDIIIAVSELHNLQTQQTVPLIFYPFSKRSGYGFLLQNPEIFVPLSQPSLTPAVCFPGRERVK